MALSVVMARKNKRSRSYLRMQLARKTMVSMGMNNIEITSNLSFSFSDLLESDKRLCEKKAGILSTSEDQIIFPPDSFFIIRRR